MKEMWMDADPGGGYTVSCGCTPSFLARSSFLYIQSIGHFNKDEHYYTRREGLQNFLLIYTIDGEGRLEYRGKRYEPDRGTVMIIDCYDLQEYRTAEKSRWEFKYIHFNGANSQEYFKLIYENCGPVIRMPPGNCMEERIDTIVEMIQTGDRQMELKSSCILVELLTEIILAGTATASGAIEGNKHYMLVENVLEFIENSYSKVISLKDLSDRAHCSRYYFSRIFKKQTGYSPYEYLIKFRINKAKTLLQTSEETVEGIAFQVGFDSPSNFIRTFRELEGMTPLKYRNYWVGK